MMVPIWIVVLLLVVLMTVALIVLIVVMAVRVAQGATRTSPYGEGGGPGDGAPLESVPTALDAARRRATRIATLAWVAAAGGVVLAPVLAVGAMRVDEVAVWGAALLVGLAFLAVHAVGEGTWPRPTGTARRAPLVVRSVRQVAASGPRRFVWAWAAATVAVAVAGALLADESGRGITAQTDEAWGRATPFPGAPHGIGAVVTVVLVLVGPEVVLRQITQRRAVPDLTVAHDLALRRLAARRVAAGSQAVVAGVLVVLLGVAGSAMENLGASGPGTPLGGWGVAGSVTTTVALGVALAALAVAAIGSLRPQVRTRAAQPAPPAGVPAG